MINGKHSFISFTLFSIQILSYSIQSSTALPPYVEGIKEKVFPKVTVTMVNEANHSIYLMCGFDGGGKNRELQRVQPGEMRSWSFYEILFPLRWCYVHISNETRGAFWAFTVFLQCTTCTWSIRNDGVYYLDNTRQIWEKHKLYVE
ncbi:hypothetical protein PTKIN_Ptkin05aG0008500 [Pterospermum kingtungense]